MTVTIVIAGGSGFLGSALVRRWRAAGHRVLILTRQPRNEDDISWDPGGQDTTWMVALDDADAVVNLAGEGIADKRWTTARKAAILDSRVRATRAVVEAIRSSRQPPRVLINASAVGVYGADRRDELLTETSPPGSDFLAQVCVRWEAEAAAAPDRTRVVMVRTGLVLSADGGVLPQMARPFRMFAGGPVGSGRQYMPWIHLADWMALVDWALAGTHSGPLNATGPAPVTNEEFSRALGRALKRPSLMRAPASVLRLALGEMADALLLSGQRAIPENAQRGGFTFAFATVDEALRDIYGPT